MYMKNLPNRPNTNADRCPLNYSPNIKQNLKTEIGLRLCFATLPLVSAFGVLVWSYLLLTERLVIN